MISNFTRMTMVAGLLALGTVAAHGQSILKADVPFAFDTPAGGHMPAGKYMIKLMNWGSSAPIYQFLNVGTKQSVMALAPEVVRRNGEYNPELVFHCVREACAVSGIFHAGTEYGHAIRVRTKPSAPATDIAEIHIPLGE